LVAFIQLPGQTRVWGVYAQRGYQVFALEVGLSIGGPCEGYANGQDDTGAQ
jgi:hypothetical protein